jgi:hypothetical protein
MGERERERQKAKREGVRERQGREREKKRGDCLVMLGEQFGYAGGERYR